jgi:hypothetical protein
MEGGKDRGIEEGLEGVKDEGLGGVEKGRIGEE